MVIGNGLVARSFAQYREREDVVMFASGVSNSKTSTAADFLREQDLLTNTLSKFADRHFVYFSTTSIDDPDLKDSAYVQHKLHMESIITEKASRFNIFRVSNLAGASSNPHTVLNFFFYHIVHQEPFDLWKNTERNIIDVEDVAHVAHYILENGLFRNGVINIANTGNYPVPYIVACMEACLQKRGIYTEKELGHHFLIDTSTVLPVFKALGIHFSTEYLPGLLQKYFSAHEA
ncbi:NAD-dependent epimerase/dehydratase family protein [Paraflavitalea sp. CAU 1676]|uniref:NAD-dependent epimerase/dehydratase family protein n=1 Tax=Paraflavitalea sp. CAU 1676 TaxID=3032598 RepID=UPI0023D9F3C7|nr:NAD-dependent epimerase/dehydratase family protein [Paraflavitalea sp. CAU 1676]MDF2188773.1 NAD-dependent epimerase/dehydratase family protein [Paraflavitalea sp. CAU 1676]